MNTPLKLVATPSSPSVLSQFRFKSDRPLISRAALRGIASSLNFSIIALAAQHLRNLKFGSAVPEVDEHFGHDVDQRNEIDVEIEGNAVETQLREDQGFAFQLKPLELAARLKVIRDACEAELAPHAGKRMNPLTSTVFLNPFDLAAPISESLEWQLRQPMKIDEAVVKNTALVLRLDEKSIRIQLEKNNTNQKKFLHDNAAELYSIIDAMEAKDNDGHIFGIDDDETVEQRLPAINRARLFVSADNGLVAARQREVSAYMRGAPNALGNIGLIDGERDLLHAKFRTLMEQAHIKDEISDAVNNGAKRPVLQDLFPKVGLAA